MNIVILAGGFGTRLQSVVKDVPKPMADINGTPFLALLMRELLLADVDKFVLCVSYKKECIKQYFGDNFYGVPVFYSEEDEPLGTGGAIKQAFDQYNLDEALVLNGDTYVQADYVTFNEQMAKEKLAVMLKYVDNANRYGLVEVKDEQIIAFREKKEEQKAGLINAGIYRIKRDLFYGIEQTKFSFEKDVLEPIVPKLKPKYFVSGDYFIDIGLPESYAQACRELKTVVGAEGKHKALFLDRDGVINEDVHHLYKIEDCRFIDGIFDLCKTYKSQGYKLVVVTNQAGIGKGLYTEDDYHKLTAYIHNEFAKQGCEIDAEYYCPYHPEGQGKYQKKSFFRKPNPGMILKAAKDLNINLSQSVLIGDKKSDIEAGKIAGVNTTIRFYNEHNPRGDKSTSANKIWVNEF